MKHTNKQLGANQRNSLGLGTQAYSQLLSKLESNGDQPPKAAKKAPSRHFTRIEYFDPCFELTLDPGKHSQRRKIAVATRNISRGGMSVLHSNFIYPGSAVQSTLTKVTGEPVEIKGTVCRCDHRGGVVHEIGIKFEHEIFIQEYIEPDILAGISSLETVDTPQLVGKVLFVGNDPSITPFVRQYLLTTNLDFGFADSAEQAIERGIHDADLLFVTLDVGDRSGPEFIRSLRESGYMKPVILAGNALEDESTKQQIRLSAADMFLPIPLNEQTLLCALGEFLINQWTAPTLERVRSRVDKGSAAKLLEELTKITGVLDKQIESENGVELYITCTKIKRIASLLGMKALRELAGAVGELIADSGDLGSLSGQLAEIRSLCTQADNSNQQAA